MHANGGCTWLWRAVALVFVVLTLFPVYWMVNSSFEPNGQITSLKPSFFPVDFTFHNFVDATEKTVFLDRLAKQHDRGGVARWCWY